MIIDLDEAGRFKLKSVIGGWELHVDDDVVHYCGNHVEALTYLSEEIGAKADAKGLDRVLNAIDLVRDAVEKAASQATVALVTREAIIVERSAVKQCLDDGGEIRMVVRDSSLGISGCKNIDEFRSHPDRKNIVTRVKNILSVRSTM